MSTKPLFHSFSLVTLLGMTAGFLSWCVIDFILVRCVPYPEHSHDLDWTAPFFPIAQYLFAWFLLRRNATKAFASSLLACIGVVILIVLLGTPFHLAIGGSF